MDTLLDYIRWTAHQPFTRDGAGAVDNLVLCYLSYLDLRDILTQPLTMAACCRAALESGAAVRTVDGGGPCRQDILRAVAESERFGPVQPVDYEDRLDDSVQFAAVTFELPQGPPVVAFRGTDDSLAGWKEDFMLSFTQPPSQALALDYLSRALSGRDEADVAGHSKGGNLAWFASTRLQAEEQRKLRRIWLDDAPGLCPEVLDAAGIAAVREKTTLMLPVSSVIGRIFQADAGRVLVVESTGAGLLQHDLVRWGVRYGEPLLAERCDLFSEWVDAALNRWLEGVKLPEREQLVESLFEALGASGASGLQELAAQGPMGFVSVLSALTGMAPDAVLTAAKLVPAALTPDLRIRRGNTTLAERLRKLWKADGGQTATVLGLGSALLLPETLLEALLPMLLIAAALYELASAIIELTRNGWNLRAERLRVSLGVTLLAAGLGVLIKEHAPFLLLSVVIGSILLLLAFQRAMMLREKRAGRRLRRVKDTACAGIYTAAGLFILIAPAPMLPWFARALRLVLLADGLSNLAAALPGSWRLLRRKETN